ncbi:hypothetical protein HWV62_38222 [Athelia sp. TMB]|nr:hypothetical protein HWV62_38222 [Athelia sp. TMB]
MDRIPFIAIERASVRLRADGRFGEEDFTLNPQIYCKKYPHRILVRSRPDETSKDAVMWWTPTDDNFEKVALTSYHHLGRFRSNKIKVIDDLTWALRVRAFELIASKPEADWSVLEGLIANMRYGVMRLKHNPYTFMEMVMDVAQTQRLYLDGMAMCDYIQDNWANRLHSVGPLYHRTRTEFVGAWSSDPSMVQLLHHSGIPVYFVRLSASLPPEHNHATTPRIMRCESIVTADWGLPPRYTGIPGDALHSATSALNSYGDLEKFFCDFNAKGVVLPVGQRGDMHVPDHSPPKSRSRSKKPKYPQPKSTSHSVPVRDKWQEITGDFVPETIPHWSKALHSVNRNDRSPIIAPKDFTGYRFPDPGMLVFSSNRRERNLFNWLLIRDACVRRLMHDISSTSGVPRGFSNELWRMILGVEFSEGDKEAAESLAVHSRNPAIGRSASHSERRQAAIAIFGQPPDGHNHTAVQWKKHTIPWGTFFEHDPLLVREILWEIHQYSFQFDLIALDRYLCPELWKEDSTGRQNLASRAIGCDNCFIVRETPPQNFGLASEDDTERMNAYHSLGELMMPWPTTGASPSTTDAPHAYREAAARRYCQSFAKAFGRPPILPKLVPSRNHMRCRLPYKR